MNFTTAELLSLLVKASYFIAATLFLLDLNISSIRSVTT